jgi:hypothetical protein
LHSASAILSKSCLSAVLDMELAPKWRSLRSPSLTF